MVTISRAPTAQLQARPTQRQARPPRQANRPPAPNRSVPDDNAFEESIARCNDPNASEEERCQKALATLPTEVDAKNCTRMWIPAARLTAERNIDELCVSLKADYQPEIWRKYLHQGCVRDFVRIPHQGIGFVCTSEEALRCLGGVTLKVCDTLVTIRKYSLFDKLYYVDLQRLPFNVSDRDIYNWFVSRGARPVLITATHDHGMLKSRARTVYFNSVACPQGLFEPNGEPLREVFFDPADKPCFVQHRMFKYNRVRPPSLRPSPRRPSDVSDASMRTDDASASPLADGTLVSSSAPVGRVSLTPSGPRVPSSGSTAPDSSTDSMLVDHSSGSAPLEPTSGPSPSDKSRGYATVPVSSKPMRQAFTGTRSSRSRAPTVIPGTIPADAPDWKVVQHSQYGILNRTGAKFIEPGTAVPCELSQDDTDPLALSYSTPITPNYYEVLFADGYDLSLPPDVDISIAESEDDGEIYGFAADSPLHPTVELRSLKAVRRMPMKAEQVTVAELDRIISEFVEKDLQAYTSHEDVLATIHAQPAYLRQLFKIPLPRLQKIVMDHAVYRTVCAEPLSENEPVDIVSRLRARYGDQLPSSDVLLKKLFPSDDDRNTACHCALSDLFLMVFAPGIYVDPLKVKALLPQHLAPKRIRHAPFLLWSDLILTCIAHTDVAQQFLRHDGTPTDVVTALNYLAHTNPSPTVETAPSTLVRPQL
ncbi:hypothetical protein GN958_ATG15140 [Phytophthora infestans]|uniref:Uncharacterized protein n=1 Tax=Phytophthora infestans TaxID=4787 RepID=A0A8S9UBJ6_PHYIN|nr:hypothetical protein GN958_ATG15140 [Phytophthora infestans]